MKVQVYQVDAFTDTVFCGNPAAVCPLDNWLDDVTLQNIALENNLSETAFFTGVDGEYHLRWFTPGTEVDLCGHATLAAAWVLRNELGEAAPTLHFQTRSGELRVTGTGDMFTLDFPLQSPEPCEPPAMLGQMLGVEPHEVLAAEDYLVLVESEQVVRAIRPDFKALKMLPRRGVIVTAAGEESEIDFVSRWFGPKVGVEEDPVTGSAHTTLAPYWAAKLGRKELRAKQVSARGGMLICKLAGDRVLLTGTAVKYLTGTIYLKC